LRNPAAGNNAPAMKATLGSAAAALALCATAAPAMAHETPTLDSVIVTASPDPEDPPVVADARQRLSETPGAVAVVAAESYANRYAPDLAEALRDAPGVYAQKKWGGDIRLSVRGSGIGNNSHNRGVLLAQDGVPFNEADGFGDFQLIDPLIARYTEVWKGGNALRFGGALLGGAVHLVTPTGRNAEHDLTLRFDGGSHGVARQHLQAARVWGDWDVFAAVTNSTAQGYRDQSQHSARFGSLNIGRRFGEDRDVRLLIGGGDVGQEIPGALTLTQALTSPKRANPANLALDQQRNMRGVRVTAQTRWRLNGGAVFEGGVYGIWKDVDHPISVVVDQESRNFGGFGRIDWEGQAFGRRADAFYGAWLRKGDMDAQTFVNRQGARGAQTGQSRQNAAALDVFAEGRLFVTDRLAVVAGGAYGRAERAFRNLRNGAADEDRRYDWFAPRVGLLWQGEGGAQLYANVTRAVEPPNFSALVQTAVDADDFVPLEAQESWTGEAGTRGRRGALTWDVSLYRAELKHELLSFPLPGDPSRSGAFNAERTLHQGMEAALDWRFAKGWRLRQTYAWSDFRFDGDPTYGDGRLPVVPEHLYRAELKYEAPSGWFVAPSVEWSPKDPWVDYANTLKAPGYAVVSLNAGWRRDHVRVFLDARNLAGDAYVSNVNAVTDARIAPAAVFWPGEGRTAYAGLALAF
jgi:iron complex outermembrane receptor protein